MAVPSGQSPESKDIPHIITGAFRTTAGSAADVEAHLLPTLQQLEQTTLEIIMRIRTSPLYDETVHTQDNHLIQCPLHRSSKVLPGNYHVQLDRLEKRQPYVVPPWWAPRFTRTAGSLDNAIEENDATDPATLCLYTDGSGINGHVGATGIPLSLPFRNTPIKRMEYMGTSTTSAVYVAELKGIELASEIAWPSTRQPIRCANAPFSLTIKPPSRPWQTPDALQINTYW